MSNAPKVIVPDAPEAKMHHRLCAEGQYEGGFRLDCTCPPDADPVCPGCDVPLSRHANNVPCPSVAKQPSPRDEATAISPLPWKADRYGHFITTDDSQQRICDMRGWGPLRVKHGYDDKAAAAEMDANMDFIVRAVNNHDSLRAVATSAVETNADAVQALRTWAAQIAMNSAKGAFEAAMSMTLLADRMETELEAARAALAGCES